MQAARDATAVAIDCIRDGVLFGVIAGNDRAMHMYPPYGGLEPASEQSRGAAKQMVGRLRAGGGTAIGTWLRAANDAFAAAPGRVCHAILLTDGANQHETREQLETTLAGCEGRFQCDCRGVGTDWEVFGASANRVGAARIGRHHRRPRRHGCRLSLDDRGRNGKDHGKCVVADLDPPGGTGAIRPPGGSDDRGAHRPRNRRQPAHRRLPDRQLGRGVARLPRVHRGPAARRSATRCSPPGSACCTARRC